MSTLEETPLSQRLSQGAMSPAEALRSATLLADALRLHHDRGTIHGALEPSRVVFSESGATLLDGAPPEGLTPYSSPEQAQGGAPDARSDIFAFGAIVYEMVSGRKAFPGAAEELRTAILERAPDPLPAEASGLARVIARCLVKTPAQRWQRVQSVQMELKLLSVMARRAEQSTETVQSRLQAILRAEIANLEGRVNERLASLDQAADEIRAKLEAESQNLVATTQQAEALRAEIAALGGRVQTRGEEQAARLSALTAEQARIDRALAAHSSSIESVGTAVAQSDDLIERLVDAFDSMERSLAERSENKAAFATTSL
jgi:hypothetical protein